MSKLCDGVPDCTDSWDEGPHCRGKRCAGTERTARSCGSEMRSISISNRCSLLGKLMSRWAAASAIAMDFFPSSLRRKVVNLSISSAARLFPQIPVGMMSVRHGCRPERIPFKSSAIIQRWRWRMSEGTQRTWRGGLCQSTQRGNSGCLQMFASALVDNVEQLWSLLSPLSFSLKSLNQIFSSLSGSKSRSTRVSNLIFLFFLQFDASFYSFSNCSAAFSSFFKSLSQVSDFVGPTALVDWGTPCRLKLVGVCPAKPLPVWWSGQIYRVGERLRITPSSLLRKAVMTSHTRCSLCGCPRGHKSSCPQHIPPCSGAFKTLAAPRVHVCVR